MAVRTPLFINQPTGQFLPQIYEMDSATLDTVHAFASYAYAQNPSVRLEVDTANGVLMGGQPFVDTYYVAGAYSTRVDRFATEAETANIVFTTDNYNRLRYVVDSVTFPTGDTNNLQYPLYLYSVGGTTQLRTMSRQDFIDTFVSPGIQAMDSQGFYDGGTSRDQAGTYFMTTSSNPAGGTIVSNTPVAVNSQANVSAYTASGIPEAVKQTIDINYYIAKVDPAASEYDLYDSEQGTWDLPMYFDAGDENMKQHTPTSWANLLGPFLRYYIATTGSGYNIEYNINGSGNTQGTSYVDTRLTSSSTYQQRYVNTDDYRTQEFPNGTQTTVAGSTKTIKQTRGGTPTYGASANPSSSVTEGQSVTFTLSTTNVLDGTTFAYAITGITAADISSGSLTGNVTISGGTGSTTITLVAYDGTEGESVTCTFTTPGGNRVAGPVTVTDLNEVVSLEGTQVSPELDGTNPITNGNINIGWRFNADGTIEDYNSALGGYDSSGHLPWVNSSPSPSGSYWIRFTLDYDDSNATLDSGTMNTWLSLASNQEFQYNDSTATGTYGSVAIRHKVEIATDSGGSNIVATGYYQNLWDGGA